MTFTESSYGQLLWRTSVSLLVGCYPTHDVRDAEKYQWNVKNRKLIKLILSFNLKKHFPYLPGVYTRVAAVSAPDAPWDDPELDVVVEAGAGGGGGLALGVHRDNHRATAVSLHIIYNFTWLLLFSHGLNTEQQHMGKDS